MLQLTRQIIEAVATIRRHWNGSPRVGIILGTGLASFTQEIAQEVGDQATKTFPTFRAPRPWHMPGGSFAGRSLACR